MAVTLRKNCPKLLKTVNGQQHATPEDHAGECDVGLATDAEPLSSSDSDRNDSANIKPSFIGGKTRITHKSTARVAGSRQQPARGRQTDDPNDGRATKRQKVSDHEAIFDSSRPKMRKSVSTFMDYRIKGFETEAAIDRRGKSIATYLKPKEYGGSIQKVTSSKAAFKTPTSPGQSQKTSKIPEFMPSTGLLTPKSTDESRGSQNKECELLSMEGAEEYLDIECEEAAFDNDDDAKALASSIKNKRQRKNGATFKGVPNSSPPRSSAPEFIHLGTSTQMVARYGEEINPNEDADDDISFEPPQVVLPDSGPCPMKCGKILSRSKLDTLELNASIKQQQAFCQRHQVQDAEQAWKDREYPTIKWEQLQARLNGYDMSIQKMIKKPDKLHFRKQMEKRVKRGGDRTIMQHMKNEDLSSMGISAGYYGSKGFDIIMQYITARYRHELMAKAVDDKTIAARSAPGYIQMVLVPEVVTLLVKDDLDTQLTHVDFNRAREIMEESSHIGDLLHPSDDSGPRRSRRRMEESAEQED